MMVAELLSHSGTPHYQLGIESSLLGWKISTHESAPCWHWVGKWGKPFRPFRMSARLEESEFHHVELALPETQIRVQCYKD